MSWLSFWQTSPWSFSPKRLDIRVQNTRFFFFAAARSSWDLSSPTRDRIRAHGSASAVLTTGPPGKSPRTRFKPTDGAHENPRKGDRALSPKVFKNNPEPAVRPPQMETQHRGTCPTEDWKSDFPQMPWTARNFRHLLVFVWTLFQDGWKHMPPGQKISDVVKALRREIIPIWMTAVKQHSSWRPQSTGKTKKMNHTLKRNVAKTCQETLNLG